MTRRYRAYVLPALMSIVLIAAWAFGVGSIRDLVRESAFDVLLPWVTVRPAEPALIVVDIDRETLAQYGPWPWRRTTLAALMRAVAEAKPLAVGLDILLDGAAAGDDDIAAAVRLAPTVLGFVMDDASHEAVRAPALLLRGRPQLPDIWKAAPASGPPTAVGAVAAGLGALALLPDADGRIRRVPLLVNTAGILRPGLAVDLLRVGLGASSLLLEAAPPALRAGPLALPLDRDAQFRIVPSRPAWWARRTIPAAAVMNDVAARERLAGQVVLIGSGAPEVGGLRVTPVSAATPTVQIQADALERLLLGPRPHTPSFVRAFEVMAAIGLALVAAALSLRLPPLRGTLLMAAAGLAWVAGAAAVSRLQEVLLDPAGPVVLAVAAFGLFSLAAYVDNEQRAQALRQRFEQHLAPAVVRQLLENPHLLRLGGEMREVTALFTDIEGFTAMTERAEASRLVALLDLYLDAVTRVVLAHGGMVEKIVGDSVHAIFNAPVDLPDHPRRAFECARAILAASDDVRAKPLARELGLGRTRVGLETGMVIVGDVGGGRRLDYTAHGTAMNTAARLEAANKGLGTSICIGPTAAARLDPAAIRPLGPLALRGLSGPIEVFTTADGGNPAHLTDASAS
jgi:adenylate cyclase